MWGATVTEEDERIYYVEIKATNTPMVVQHFYSLGSIDSDKVEISIIRTAFTYTMTKNVDEDMSMKRENIISQMKQELDLIERLNAND